MSPLFNSDLEVRFYIKFHIKNFWMDLIHSFFILKIICIATFHSLDLCCATAQLLFGSNVIFLIFSFIFFDSFFLEFQIIIIYTTKIAACVCVSVCVQNLTNFCPYGLNSTPIST